ncbi:MAG: hypothetical protein CMJ20_10945 [Phycisphaeraceae bacterium]|nr:hypothetical protein [Phycisphaeraceae bacterium]
MTEETPKIQIDGDWKAEAQAEKQRLTEQEQTGDSSSTGGEGQMPPATFEALVSTMATQALFAMGAIADPRTGQRVAHLELARHHIDLLTVIEKKTKGNLTEEEENLLTTTLYDLRNSYIQVSTAARSKQ